MIDVEVLHRGAGNWASRRAVVEREYDWDARRERGRAVREDAVANLPELLARFEARVVAAGGRVHHAPTAADARRIVTSLCSGPIVKAKSMLADEIGLELDAVETDLGEWILQLLGDKPSHILAPAIHVPAEAVAELFSRHSGETFDAADTRRLVGYARDTLREAFLAAETGITGVNLGVAETGTLVLVESEGNIRLCSSLPRKHIALMGIERLVRDWAGAAEIMELLPLAAHGSPAATYTSLVTGVGDPDGPEELHVVLVDAGRSELRGTELESALHCIRCGACLYACPVYRQIGGHAYDGAYAGPIGAVVDDQPWLSSLCGACDDACPVGIPLSEHLVTLRAGSRSAFWETWARLWSRPSTYRATVRTGGLALRFRGAGWTPWSPTKWTDGRDAKVPPAEPFHARWKRARGG